MKRQILFKAKRVDNGEWVEGYYAYNVDDDIHIIYTTLDRLPLEVDGNTVCQYTGLKDKNGKMIWEGDVLSYKEELRHIEYMDDQCRYILTNGKGYDTRNCINLDCDIVYYSELTGNIHD